MSRFGTAFVALALATASAPVSGALAQVSPGKPQSGTGSAAGAGGQAGTRGGSAAVGPYTPGPSTAGPSTAGPSGSKPPAPTPSVTLKFDFGPRSRTPAPFARQEEESPDTAIAFVAGPRVDLPALQAHARVRVLETAAIDSIGLMMVVVQLPPGDSPAAAVERLRGEPGVVWAQPNHIYRSLGAVGPLPRAFALQGLTPEVMSRPAVGTLAMIDTPVAINHEAFRGVRIEQQLFDSFAVAGAHGTAVAAIMMGAGVWPGSGQGARLVNLAAFRQAGGEGPSTSETRYLVKAFEAAGRLRPNVLNLSFGGPEDRVLDTLVTALAARGVCLVAAAGNDGPVGRPPFPASHPAVLGVTAVDESLHIYPAATPGPQVAVAAIGVDLVAAVPGGYRRVSGTSFASAFVSGALMHDTDCTRAGNPAAMRAGVAAAARDLGPRGPDDVFGAGLFRLPVGNGR